MGKIQFQLRVLHMPLLGWKGSYVVSKVQYLTQEKLFSSLFPKYFEINIFLKLISWFYSWGVNEK